MKPCTHGISQRSRIATRVAGGVIASFLMVFGVAHGQHPRPHVDQTSAAKKDSAKTLILQKLESIIIPKIDFEDTTLEEVIDYLRLRATELDSEKDPAKKGISIVIRRAHDAGAAAGPDLKIRELRLRNIAIGTALKSICDLTKLRYTVDDTAVIISPEEKH